MLSRPDVSKKYVESVVTNGEKVWSMEGRIFLKKGIGGKPRVED